MPDPITTKAVDTLTFATEAERLAFREKFMEATVRVRLGQHFDAWRPLDNLRAMRMGIAHEFNVTFPPIAPTRAEVVERYATGFDWMVGNRKQILRDFARDYAAAREE